MEEDDLPVDVLDEDEERLSAVVDLPISAEVAHNGQVDAQEGTGNRLCLGCSLATSVRISLNGKKREDLL